MAMVLLRGIRVRLISFLSIDFSLFPIYQID